MKNVKFSSQRIVALLENYSGKMLSDCSCKIIFKSRDFLNEIQNILNFLD